MKRIGRRPSLLLLLVTLLVGCRWVERRELPVDLPPVVLAGELPAPPPPRRPPHNPLHVVLISIDTLRADHLSAYGYPRETSPAIDALARESVLFENAYSQSPKTAESHMTLFTGLYPAAHGVRNWREQNQRLGEDVPTLARLLRRAGYRTVAYTGGANMRAELGFDQGFDSFETIGDAGVLFGKGAAVLEEMAGVSSRPTFLFLHTYATHDPYTPPDAYASRFADPDYRGDIVHDPAVLRRLAGEGEWANYQRAYWDRVNPDDPADLQHLLDLYDAAIRYADDQLAGFLVRFRSLGLGDDSILLLLSDHGEQFYEHEGFRHNGLYQEILRVPLLMRLPGSGQEPAGTRVSSPVRLLDVLPTLLDSLGLPVPGHVQGRSLRPLLRGEEREPRYVFSQWKHWDMESLRVGDWKYLRRKSHEALFHLGEDPAESRPVRHRALTRRLREDAARLREASERARAAFASGESFGLDETRRGELQALGYLVGGDG